MAEGSAPSIVGVQREQDGLRAIPLLKKIANMAETLAGSRPNRWFENQDRRPLRPVRRHGEATLEERAVDTVHFLFSLFNVPRNGIRPAHNLVALEMSTLVENHYILWKEFEQRSEEFSDHAAFADYKRMIAFSHEVIFKAGILWQRLLDMLYLQCRQGGNIYDASVPAEMSLSYERAFEMRAMLADPPPVVQDEEAGRKKRDMELVVAHLLDQARTGKFRKRGNVVYEQKQVSWQGGRYATCAWIPASFGSDRGEEQHTLESFVLYFCKKDLYPEMHGALLRCLPVRKVADFLMLCDETDFPFVKPKRNLLSFKNGVFDTTGQGLGEWFEYGSSSTSRLKDEAAAKYFDSVMPAAAFDSALGCRHSGWWDIPTPLFQSAAPLSVHRTDRRTDAEPSHPQRRGPARRLAAAGPSSTTKSGANRAPASPISPKRATLLSVIGPRRRCAEK